MTDPRLSDELYRSTVCRMMESHAARLFQLVVTVAGGIRHAPGAAWLRFVGGQVRELTALYAQLAALYETVAGVALDASAHGADHAPPEGAASWPEALAAQLVAGRQCRWQLHEHDLCSYAPYREFVVRAVAELDARHALIETALDDVTRDPASANALHARLEPWMRWAVEAFGRPNTPGMAYAIHVGLRRRDASATAHDFVEDLRAVARAHGVTLPPRWSPPAESASLVAALSGIARAH